MTSERTDAPNLEALVEGFRSRAEPLGVQVIHVDDSAAAAAALGVLVEEWAAGRPVASGQVIDAAPGLFAALEARGVVVERAESPDGCRDKPMGIGLGLAALAETGSVIVAEESLADRSAGMLTSALALLAPSGALLPGLDQAAPVLREIAKRGGGRFATLITGPSRTADIERVLTVGVQGPGKVAVLFVDDLG